jgi:hypothetical protein
MDLYNLPKDMLVKLVSEIQEETEKRCKEIYEKVIREENHLHSYSSNCDFCESFLLHDKDGKFSYTSEYNSMDDFKFCDYCGDISYCKKHFYLFKKVCPTKTISCFENLDRDCLFCEECYNFLERI